MPAKFVFFIGSLFAIAAAKSTHAVETESSLDLVPSNASAFLHIQPKQLGEIQGMKIVANLISEVREEADQLSQYHAGFPVSALQDVTFVAPTFKELQSFGSSESFSGLVLLKFSDKISKKRKRNKLIDTWQKRRFEGFDIYVNSDSNNAFFWPESDVIACGTIDSVSWFIDHRKNREESGLRPALDHAGLGQIAVGINGETIPASMKSMAPKELAPFIQAKYALVALRLDHGVGLTVKMELASNEDARFVKSSAQEKIQYALKFLNTQENDTEKQFKANFEQLDNAMESLALLSVIRMGQQILNDVHIEQNGPTVDASANINSVDGPILAISALTAIQAIGTKAEQDFAEISRELDAARSSE